MRYKNTFIADIVVLKDPRTIASIPCGAHFALKEYNTL